jgi:hypothetical protein
MSIIFSVFSYQCISKSICTSAYLFIPLLSTSAWHQPKTPKTGHCETCKTLLPSMPPCLHSRNTLQQHHAQQTDALHDYCF